MTISQGSRLGSYEVLGPLGAGGMGEVYRARDTKLGREVAIKVLPAEVAGDPERLGRFEREARSLAALNHPGVVTIYSVEQSGKTHYLAMELVEGEGLDVAMAAGGFPLERFFEVALPLVDALSAAHERGIVHRDLKPSNVMITRDGRVKVLDFGLAKLAAPGPDGTVTDMPTASRVELTGEGKVFGTVAYMSPEQARGGKIDARSDVFSLGIVLYQMLTGDRPFHGDSNVDMISSILRDRPHPVTEIRPELPPQLARILRRCLEKDPRDRYQTSRDVYNELKELRQEASLTTTVPPPRRRPETTSPLISASAAIRVDEEFVAIAVLPFEDLSAAKDQEYLCEGMAEEIMNALVRVPGIRVAARASAFRAAREGHDLPAIGRVLSVSHILEGSVRTAASSLRVTARLTGVETGYQLWSQRYDREAADVFALQDEIAAGVVEAVRAKLSPGDQAPVRVRPQVTNLEAYRHYLMGRHLRYSKNDFAAAAKEFAEAVRLDPAYAPSWVSLSEVRILGTFYGLDRAAETFASARQPLAKARAGQGESAEALYVEGLISFGERDWSSCEKSLRRALELAPDYPPALCWSGMLKTILGRGGPAEDFRRAREADPLAPYPYAMQGISLLLSRQPAEAEAVCDQALAFEPENTLALWGAGVSRVALNRGADGIAMLEKALTPFHRRGFIHGALGWALAAAGRNDDARQVLAEFRERPATAPAVVSEAWILGALGDADAAFRVLEQAETEHQPSLAFIGMPGFDSLRADPRFGALLARMGLPPSRA
ncbi:MAG TPA: protein kinase [Thermoanaerobaculia bacterium]|nr:protein kinase [Thermoanaerobaculia bacterium]